MYAEYFLRTCSRYRQKLVYLIINLTFKDEIRKYKIVRSELEKYLDYLLHEF